MWFQIGIKGGKMLDNLPMEYNRANRIYPENKYPNNIGGFKLKRNIIIAIIAILAATGLGMGILSELGY